MFKFMHEYKSLFVKLKFKKGVTSYDLRESYLKGSLLGLFDKKIDSVQKPKKMME
jgi:hypothetical protein